MAKRIGVNAKTIRYYEQVGLLPPARRTPSGYRNYTDEDAGRLEFIRSAKRLGVTLDEIKEVLTFRDRGAAPCPYVLDLIEAKAEEIEQRIRGLRLLAADLKRPRQAGARLPRQQVAATARFCHILENQALLRANDRDPRRGRHLRGGTWRYQTLYAPVSPVYTMLKTFKTSGGMAMAKKSGKKAGRRPAPRASARTKTVVPKPKKKRVTPPSAAPAMESSAAPEAPEDKGSRKR